MRIDEEPELRQLIAARLRQERYTVETAGDGDEALEETFEHSASTSAPVSSGMAVPDPA